MTYQTPCSDPEKRDDWFIGRDGKQYPDDDILTQDDLQKILDSVDENMPLEEVEDFVREALADAEEEAKRQALIRRRKARDACYECYFRTDCLNTVLSDDTIRHGTWGGYTEEQIREIRTEKRKRDRRNGTQE